MFEERKNNDLIEILRSVQAVVGQNGNQNGYHSKLSDFQRTKPPSFSQVIDPLEADDWLRTIEKKLEIAHAVEGDKVPFATHYLEGAAAIWWDNAKAMSLRAKKSLRLISRTISTSTIFLLEL